MSGPQRTEPGRWRLPPSRCPDCDSPMDGAANHPGEDAPPDPEDITLCMACGAILQFGPLLQLVPVEADNLAQFRRDHPDAVLRLERSAAWIKANIAKHGR